MSEQAVENTGIAVEVPEATPRRRSEGRSTRGATKTRTKTPKTPQTKKQRLIGMLRGKAGADVPTISEKLGWQQHTTRAALTHLRKAGYGIAAEKPVDGRPARYRITAAPEKG